jgi:hypothetical protein
MSWTMVSGIGGAMTRTAVAVALVGLAATGATVPANATPGFGGMPGTPVPLDNPPTGPDDPACLGAALFIPVHGRPIWPSHQSG